ncbi:MAG: DUF1638 domain-containing protein [Dehalococcoidia bacterium]|jgi:hypothetical protein|nr:DUF1638 domain-containing protein [Candidatus Poribacteria bacterium]MDP6960593.1 DUF1638 domain-containing protein [Dehalococcoidia bacterium]MDP7674705.1 DUF1638 domain-containing protein [Dehalococcoidia bacterium]|tara:strand:- start:966 stop:1703 length:738 start_codon:yes stop_codon:yes gene_type:complete
MFIKIIACEIAHREICYVSARSPNLADLEFLTQGYHDNTDIGRSRIQERIDAVPEGKFDAILVGYGLCNMMLEGLTTHHTPLVIPRAHDCITFFLGSKEHYKEAFAACPGTYYYSAGWLEHRQRGGERVERKPGAGMGVQLQYEEQVKKYGEDNARYLMEFFNQWTNHYQRGALIQFNFTRHLNLKEQVLDICDKHGWSFEELEGDLGLLEQWVNGAWDEDNFLIVHPGKHVIATYNDGIMGIKD